MIQRFIELGEGYSDIYELLETAKANKTRVHGLLSLQSEVDGRLVTSIGVIMKPTDPGEFQAIYVCREGIPNPAEKPNKRSQLFQELSIELEKKIIKVKVKPSNAFNEKILYYQYLIGILRLNHIIPPMK
ncbi:DUF7147 family protein [Metabacillus sp. RGM 3146]|uniref:DUF7147 family protein n=1 Tax=Metabacillus sp. RGM 3146 TaxID=3401092 RepID=UPI003B98F106